MNGHLQLRPFCFPGPNTVLLDYDGISFMEQQASGLACPFKKVSGN